MNAHTSTPTHQVKNTVVSRSATIHMSMIVTIVMMKMGATTVSASRLRGILRTQTPEPRSLAPVKNIRRHKRLTKVLRGQRAAHSPVQGETQKLQEGEKSLRKVQNNNQVATF